MVSPSAQQQRSAPLAGRGFLFLPLKDIVDQVYSVYFHIVSDASQAPLECSPYREKWADEEADTPLMPVASRDLASKLVTTKSAKWAHVKGLEFRAQGELKTPWGHGKWGVLIDKPGVAFADFGGAMHEITFERWPCVYLDAMRGWRGRARFDGCVERVLSSFRAV